MTGRAIFRGKRNKRLAQLRTLLLDPRAHFAFMRAMGHAREHGTAPSTLLSRVKYLGVYLAERMEVDKRRQAILFHHDFLADVVERGAWRAPLAIWTGGDERAQLTILLRPATLSPMEGEHELVFLSDGRELYTLTFVLVPAPMIGIEGRSAMFIGGVQGGVGVQEAIRTAAKANGEIAPSAMLMVAAKALARAIGVPRLIGIPADQHPSRGYAAERMKLDYDRLWYDAGAALTDNGWFSVHPRAREKPLEEVPRSHRARTRRKRERKAQLFDEIATNLLPTLKPGRQIYPDMEEPCPPPAANDHGAALP